MGGRVIRVRPCDLSVRIRVPACASALVAGVTIPEREVWLSGAELADTTIELEEATPSPKPGLARTTPRPPLVRVRAANG